MALKKKGDAIGPTSRGVVTVADNNVQTKTYTQTTVCFNLAVKLNVAECALIHAIAQFQLRA